MLEFFQALSTSGLIAIAPGPGSNSLDLTSSEKSNPSNDNLLIVQIPKKEAAEKALRIIMTNSKQSNEIFQGRDEFRYLTNLRFSLIEISLLLVAVTNSWRVI